MLSARVVSISLLVFTGSLELACGGGSDSNTNGQTSDGGTANGGSAGSTAGTAAGGESTTAGSGGDGEVAGGGGGGGDSTAGTGGTSEGGAAGNGGEGGAGGGFTVPTVTWPSAECSAKAATLLGMMTPQEKAAQMVMAPNPSAADVTTEAPGAVFAPGGAVPPGGSTAASWAAMVDGYMAAAQATRLQIPILYGLDAVHGDNGATDAVIFPHNIGLGCTGNPTLVQQVTQITAQETKATGVTWAFAPVVSVSWDDRWGRVFESFSEDVNLTAQLSAASVMGLQGANGLGSGTPGIVACAKHWAGDGMATAGTSSKGGIVDRGNIEVDEATMRAYGIAPYLPALQAGLGSIMVSDARWNGQSLTGSSRMMTEILKGELGFKGFIATDWNAASEAPGPGIAPAVAAGVDMLMNPDDWKGAINQIVTGVNMGTIPAARVDDAVTRILSVKCEAGLFEYQRDPAALASVGSAEHRAVGREAVRESLVLLQNTGNALPLAKTDSVWVGGTGGDSLARQCGGWTISWQGDGSQIQGGTTIKQAIGKVAPLAASMDQADVAVVVLSEKPYAEFEGDSATVNTLPPDDFTLLAQAKAAGKKVVAIVLSGRPVLIADALANADAWIAAWLPGSEGDGVADVLFGDYAPTGKLSHSWPRTDDQVRINFGDPGYDPLFPLGFGLSY